MKLKVRKGTEKKLLLTRQPKTKMFGETEETK